MNKLEEERLFKNLECAGCDIAKIKIYFELEKAGKKQEQLQLLSQHKASLLDQPHVSQKMMSCLNYLTHVTEKNNLG